jgi:hypothetical protein
VPALAGVDVAARIAELVEQHRPELEEIARELVDRTLVEIVDHTLVEIVDQELAATLGRLAASTNGATSMNVVSAIVETGLQTSANGVHAPALCASCGERPRLPARSVCGRCKNRRDVDRRREQRAPAEAAPAGDDQEPPRPVTE